MNICELAAEIAAISPGQWYTVSPHTLADIAPAMPLAGPLGPTWTPAERVMEKIVGSAYEFQFWSDPRTGNVTFARLKQPLKDGSRTYVSPDRRDRFTQTPDGFYCPNTEAR